jgi:Zn-finger nucleic acid-binding protein
MGDEKDRLGDTLHNAGMARENQWARQHDAEIIERLRLKYAKGVNCPQCGHRLDARVAIGVGGMACPTHHGAWCDKEALEQIDERLENAAALHRGSLTEKAFGRIPETVGELRREYPRGIDCPDCGARLNARAAVGPGERGLVGMACPKDHGAWIDEGVLREIRKRLDTVLGTHRSGETRR